MVPNEDRYNMRALDQHFGADDHTYLVEVTITAHVSVDAADEESALAYAQDLVSHEHPDLGDTPGVEISYAVEGAA